MASKALTVTEINMSGKLMTEHADYTLISL